MRGDEMKYILAYDLGTGGIKASMFDLDGHSCGSIFWAYDTQYSGDRIHEQRPDVWIEGIIRTTPQLLKKVPYAEDVEAISISGHSLGVVPVDENGELLREYTPIWSDTRAWQQAEEFFGRTDYESWYKRTGNGFPAECYALFKIMWYRDNEPDMFKCVYKILGSKDYCNLRLTGRMATDHSYASGSGAYDLKKQCYSDDFLEIAGIDRKLLPEILYSHDVVGTLTDEMAEKLGLPNTVKVMAGGVDNSCMALGARGIKDDRIYMSLGSSGWIAVTGSEPMLDAKYKPFVFAHVIPGMYASATSIFAAGSSLRWVRDSICPDLAEKEANGSIDDAYVEMNRMAAASEPGANGLLYNPSLAGGAMIEESKNICGGFVGLRLAHTRNDLVRSAMEGIAYNLRYALEVLRQYNVQPEEMLAVGGGAKSPFWLQMFADVFKISVLKTGVEQDCASLGAAAIALFGLGYWKDYSRIDEIHQLQHRYEPNALLARVYDTHYELSRKIAHFMALSGDMLDADLKQGQNRAISQDIDQITSKYKIIGAKRQNHKFTP